MYTQYRNNEQKYQSIYIPNKKERNTLQITHKHESMFANFIFADERWQIVMAKFRAWRICLLLSFHIFTTDNYLRTMGSIYSHETEFFSLSTPPPLPSLSFLYIVFLLLRKFANTIWPKAIVWFV